MDVVSGAVHVVDQLCYDVIAGICKLKEEHILEKIEEEDPDLLPKLMQ